MFLAYAQTRGDTHPEAYLDFSSFCYVRLREKKSPPTGTRESGAGLVPYTLFTCLLALANPPQRCNMHLDGTGLTSVRERCHLVSFMLSDFRLQRKWRGPCFDRGANASHPAWGRSRPVWIQEPKRGHALKENKAGFTCQNEAEELRITLIYGERGMERGHLAGALF